MITGQIGKNNTMGISALPGRNWSNPWLDTSIYRIMPVIIGDLPEQILQFPSFGRSMRGRRNFPHRCGIQR